MSFLKTLCTFVHSLISLFSENSSKLLLIPLCSENRLYKVTWSIFAEADKVKASGSVWWPSSITWERIVPHPQYCFASRELMLASSAFADQMTGS